ncbi:TniB family NTP-binding protein [Belnapia sp. T18]|uniref:TniB family NTP-binding protein n=1 Tax=Belnapia arida TaxID=2804533 RepID=A0ABS1U3F2_9PROT|nr:TniB family NTP-binding protein [Belnapia arida]
MATTALALLQEVIDQPPRERLENVLLMAESGMGKTSLIRKFERANAAAGRDGEGVRRMPVVAGLMPPEPTEHDFGQVLAALGAPSITARPVGRAVTSRRDVACRCCGIGSFRACRCASPRRSTRRACVGCWPNGPAASRCTSIVPPSAPRSRPPARARSGSPPPRSRRRQFGVAPRSPQPVRSGGFLTLLALSDRGARCAAPSSRAAADARRGLHLMARPTQARRHPRGGRPRPAGPLVVALV